MPIKLRIKHDKKYWLKKRDRLDRRTTYYRKELPAQLTRAYFSAIVTAISKQDFPVEYAPLSAAYIKRKGHGQFWKNSGAVLSNAKAFMQGSILSTVAQHVETATHTTYTIDFPPKIQEYIGYMEEGTGKMPARPLFTPVFEELVGEFEKQTGTIFADLQRIWRR